MSILLEIIGEFFCMLFGMAADEVGGDRQIPKFVKILLLIFALCVIGAILFICWKFSQ